MRGESNPPRFLSAPFTVFLALVFVRRHITSDETRKNEKFILSGVVYSTLHALRGIKMDVDFIFKVAAIGIIVTVLHQLLVRSGREEQAMLVTLSGLVVVLLMVVGAIADLFGTVKGLFGL